MGGDADWGSPADGIHGSEPTAGDRAPLDETAAQVVAELLADLRTVLADATVDEAVLARTRERWLRRQAEEAATLTGLLIDLAEHRRTIILRTTAGQSHQGRMLAVTSDCCVMRTGSGAVVLVPLHTVATIRPAPGEAAPDPATSRQPAVPTTFAAILSDLAGDRPRVRIVCSGPPGETLTGELRAAGEDVITLRIDSDPPATVYVRVASLSEVSLLGSG